ncbi:MAG: IMP dehydrogenase [Thermodesulfobacteriota bacterium]|nr:IMP dehydrogenase [Thermodesulfobacteriota bacterium]
MEENSMKMGLTFDDVLLLPAMSEVLPSAVNITTNLTSKIKLNIPLLSAAMDTVTESDMAIAMAREGGIGIIHGNMSIEDQASEVDKVKKSESGIITDPITMHPDQQINEALEVMRRYKISGVPIVKDGKLAGILTNRDLRFETNLNAKISKVMTKENLVTASPGIDLEESKRLLHQNRIEKLLMVDEDGTLKGLITIKDIEKMEKYPIACKDQLGRLRVGAAVSVGKDSLDRVEALCKVSVDVVVIDTAHGHSQSVVKMTTQVKEKFPNLQIISGNVATQGGAESLIQAGADAIKVGVGPGSICTTRIIAGVGVPQLTAIMDCAKTCERYGVPLIADGGIKFSGDIVKAIAGGADTVMIGSLFAGTDESPGEMVLYQGRSYKVYRGMGSLEAMKEGGRKRYMQGYDGGEMKFVPEGIEGRIPYRGSVSNSVFQLLGGLRSGMGYLGCDDINELKKKSTFIQITGAGLRESHVHNVIITKEAPNYQIE